MKTAEGGTEGRILNVNDNPGSRYVVTQILRRAGYEVREVGSGEEALPLLTEWKADLIVLDIRLPGINGLEVCRRIKLDPAMSGTKVLCTSATFVTHEHRVQGLEVGADGYLTQPFEQVELVATVRSLLRLASAERELRERAGRLEEANRRKNEFLAMLGHELRNPLAAIRTSLAILDHPAIQEGMRDQALDVIRRQSGNLGRIVDDLLEVSRVTRGKIELRREILDLGKLLRGLVAMTEQTRTGPRNQALRLQLPEEPLLIDADPTRIEQIFNNLLDNASKYSDPGSHIDVRVIPGLQERTVRIRVEDDGMGIDARALPFIFDLFAQADVPLARSSGGLGIGLTLTRALVELHGGTIRVESEGPGRGSQVEVVLKLHEPANAVAA